MRKYFRGKHMVRCVVGVFLSFVFSGVLGAQMSKLSDELQNINSNANVDVIVQFKHDLTPAHHQRVTDRGGKLRFALPHIRAGAYSIPARRLAELAADDEVAYISPDRKVHSLLDNTAGAVRVAAAWNAGLNGSGIGIALIDSGISYHDDLMQGRNRVVYSADFVGGGTSDRYGHGEHVAGILAGDGLDSKCGNCTRHFIGMAPNANLLDLRVLDQNGEASDSSVILAIYWAILLKPFFNVRVMNLSLGRPVYESYTRDPLCQAVEVAWKAGIVVVVAAGNDGRDNSVGNNGYGTINSPGNDPYVITVGAMKSMGTPDR